MNFKIFKSEEKKENDFFEIYNNKVSVIGFKQSWVSEINNDMKEIYEKKDEKDKEYKPKEKK